jgi:ubiquinone/menaquinone biosynthesis C-methylase UbiE
MKKNYFKSKGAARAYAKGRPYHHDRVVELAKAFLEIESPLQKALDIGCGTGLSSVALKEVADEIVAVDVSREMLSEAPIDSQIQYLNATAEHLPFATSEFDLVTIASAFHWFDEERFIEELKRVLKKDARVVIYETHLSHLADCPEFKEWISKTFRKRYPGPPRCYEFRRARFEDRGLSLLGEESFEFEFEFDISEMADHFLSMSYIITAVDAGTETLEGASDWLRKELQQFPAFRIGGPSKGKGRIVFAGTIRYLRNNE